jgi:hypothetical protein
MDHHDESFTTTDAMEIDGDTVHQSEAEERLQPHGSYASAKQCALQRRNKTNKPEKDFYNYIKFFCVHYFEGKPYMLMYSEYRHSLVINGLVKDAGHWVDGF